MKGENTICQLQSTCITQAKNGAARAFAQEMIESGTVDAIRKEEGNEKYEYFLPLEDPETVLLIDQWKDQKSIDDHHASPMMQKIAKLRDQYDLHMKVERFTSDTAQDAHRDEKFIRR